MTFTFGQRRKGIIKSETKAKGNAVATKQGRSLKLGSIQLVCGNEVRTKTRKMVLFVGFMIIVLIILLVLLYLRFLEDRRVKVNRREIPGKVSGNATILD